MSTVTEEFPKRLPLSMLVSVALHGAVIAGILFASFHQSVNVPTPEAAINVTMVAPEVQPEAAKSESQPVTPEPPAQPTPQPAVTAPAPRPETPVEKPVPVEKPTPKPVVKPPRHEVKKRQPETPPKKVVAKKTPPLDKPRTENSSHLLSSKATDANQTRPQTAPKSANTQQQSVSQGKPQALSISRPAYPARALAFHLEGRVRVKFDVDSDGRVVNAQIIEAQPKNMFEREVRQAMKRWRYQSGKPATGLTMNIVFKIDGSSSVE